MADVTIDQLTPGTPSSSASIPFSDGGVTKQVAPGNILANAGNVGINNTSPTVALDIKANFPSGIKVAPTSGQSGTGPAVSLDVISAAGQYTAARIHAENTNNTVNDGGLLKIFCAAEDSTHTLTERLKISSAGIDGKNINPIALIKGTNQVVTNSASYPDTKAILNNPQYDRYNKWDNTNYRYIIPTTATYHFDFNFKAFIRDANQYFRVFFYKNNSSVISRRDVFSDTGDGLISGSIGYVGSFNANDFVEVWVKSNSYWGGSYAYECTWTESVLVINRV